MNKKHLQSAALMMLFTFINPSLAMGGKVFQLAKIIGMSTLPMYGFCEAYRHKKMRDEFQAIPISDELTSEENLAINKWFSEKKNQLNISNPESITLVSGEEWASLGGKSKKILINPYEARRLSQALMDKTKYEKERFEVIQKRTMLISNNSKINYDQFIKRQDMLIAQCDEKIASVAAVVNHELGHFVRNDSQIRIIAKALVPVGVEAVFFASALLLHKLLIRTAPKTSLSTILRSGVAIGSIIPKALIGSSLLISLYQKQEIDADKYALSNLTSCAEFKTFEKTIQSSYDSFEYYLAYQPERLPIFQLPNIPEAIQQRYDSYIGEGLQVISQEINDLFEQEEKGCTISEQKIENLVKLAHDVTCFTHPDDKQRLKMARDYHNKWHQKHGEHCFCEKNE